MTRDSRLMHRVPCTVCRVPGNPRFGVGAVFLAMLLPGTSLQDRMAALALSRTGFTWETRTTRHSPLSTQQSEQRLTVNGLCAYPIRPTAVQAWQDSWLEGSEQVSIEASHETPKTLRRTLPCGPVQTVQSVAQQGDEVWQVRPHGIPTHFSEGGNCCHQVALGQERGSGEVLGEPGHQLWQAVIEGLSTAQHNPFQAHDGGHLDTLGLDVHGVQQGLQEHGCNVIPHCFTVCGSLHACRREVYVRSHGSKCLCTCLWHARVWIPKSSNQCCNNTVDVDDDRLWMTPGQHTKQPVRQEEHFSVQTTNNAEVVSHSGSQSVSF